MVIIFVEIVSNERFSSVFTGESSVSRYMVDSISYLVVIASLVTGFLLEVNISLKTVVSIRFGVSYEAFVVFPIS